MIRNITKTSATMRILIGATLLSLFVANIVTGMVGLTLFSLSGVLLISGLFRSCPLTYFLQKAKIYIK
jgi:hypothetical protein